MKSAAQKMYESWQHNHPSRGSIPPWDKATPEARAEWEARATPAAQPAPASTGRLSQDDVMGLMRAAGIPESHCRTLYAGHGLTFTLEHFTNFANTVLSAPVAARELDVEAERREFEAVYSDNGAHSRAIERQGSSYLLMSTHQAWTWWLEAARSIAARSAAQGTAPVDTVNRSSERVQNTQGNRHVENLTDAEIECLWHEACLKHVDLDDSAIPDFARAIEAKVAARFRAKGGNTKHEGAVQVACKTAETRMDTGSEALSEGAPVSTEQAGDAWGVGSCGCQACNPHMVGRMMFICATCGDKRCPHAANHVLNCQGRAPSPNNPPVGGKGEQ